MLWDAIVLGGGPAGVSAATTLHRAGAKVLLLDRKQFPRPKACAGMLSASAVAAAPFPLPPVIRGISRAGLIRRNGQETLLYERNILTHRIELDDYMFQQARLEGVPFRQIGKLARLTDTGHGVRVNLQTREFLQARVLVGADGANSTVRRLLGIPPVSRHAFSVETDLPVQADPSTTPALFDFDAAIGGYGWWFPKGRSSNYGIALMEGPGEPPTAVLQRFLERLYLPQGLHAPLRGAAIGAFGKDTLLGKGNILLCGDAAGLADPVTGEGISLAFRSGHAAALAIIQASLPGDALTLYTETLAPLLATLQKRATSEAKFSYGTPCLTSQHSSE